ncbi:MAG: hypothetical protein HY817_00120 [Candidatus Abawacabacteria bacterium]|nr:hypothetical protein [Candidatus Abawacabacteria bacterium]
MNNRLSRIGENNSDQWLQRTAIACVLAGCVPPKVPADKVPPVNHISASSCELAYFDWHDGVNGGRINQTLLTSLDSSIPHLTIAMTNCAADVAAAGSSTTEYPELSSVSGTIYKVPVMVNCTARNQFSPQFFAHGLYHRDNDGGEVVTVHFPNFSATVRSYWPVQMSAVRGGCTVRFLGQEMYSQITVDY